MCGNYPLKNVSAQFSVQIFGHVKQQGDRVISNYLNFCSETKSKSRILISKWTNKLNQLKKTKINLQSKISTQFLNFLRSTDSIQFSSWFDCPIFSVLSQISLNDHKLSSYNFPFYPTEYTHTLKESHMLNTWLLCEPTERLHG